MTEQRAEQRTERSKISESRKDLPWLDSDTLAEDEPTVFREQYSYSWYLPADHTKSPGSAPPQPFEPAGPEPEFEDQPAEEMEASVPVPTTRYVQQHFFTSPGIVSKILSNKLRISAIAGWSAVSAVGAVGLMIRNGPTLATSMAELGAVWAGITVGLWVFTTKLGK
jgi:hypothetical protein